MQARFGRLPAATKRKPTLSDAPSRRLKNGGGTGLGRVLWECGESDRSGRAGKLVQRPPSWRLFLQCCSGPRKEQPHIGKAPIPCRVGCPGSNLPLFHNPACIMRCRRNICKGRWACKHKRSPKCNSKTRSLLFELPGVACLRDPNLPWCPREPLLEAKSRNAVAVELANMQTAERTRCLTSIVPKSKKRRSQSACPALPGFAFPKCGCVWRPDGVPHGRVSAKGLPHDLSALQNRGAGPKHVRSQFV